MQRTIEHWMEWMEEQKMVARRWGHYEMMVCETSFEEYLAGDLPKPPCDEIDLTPPFEKRNGINDSYRHV